MLCPLDVHLAWEAGRYVARHYEPMTILIAALLAYFVVSRVAAVVGLIVCLVYHNHRLEKRLATK